MLLHSPNCLDISGLPLTDVSMKALLNTFKSRWLLEKASEDWKSKHHFYVQEESTHQQVVKLSLIPGKVLQQVSLASVSWFKVLGITMEKCLINWVVFCNETICLVAEGKVVEGVVYYNFSNFSRPLKSSPMGYGLNKWAVRCTKHWLNCQAHGGYDQFSVGWERWYFLVSAGEVLGVLSLNLGSPV